MDGHLLGEQKPGAQPRRLRAQCEHGGHAASVPDPAGSDHGHRCHRVHDGRHQGKRRDLAPYVPTSLPTLRHDDIDSAGGCPPRLFGAADRVQDEAVGLVDLLDIAGGISPEQRHDPQTRFKGLVKALVLIGVENQIAAERTIGEGGRVTHHVSGGSGPRQRQHAERAGIRDCCRQFGHRRHRRLDDRLFNPEQLADRRSHYYLLPFRSGSQRVPPASTRTSPAGVGSSTFRYDSYDVGID